MKIGSAADAVCSTANDFNFLTAIESTLAKQKPSSQTI
jgi:hypothetical protein